MADSLSSYKREAVNCCVDRDDIVGGGSIVIVLHRLNDTPFVLNAELIRTVEEKPDTVITLINGDHLVVKESMSDVVDRSVEYGRRLRYLIPPS